MVSHQKTREQTLCRAEVGECNSRDIVTRPQHGSMDERPDKFATFGRCSGGGWSMEAYSRMPWDHCFARSAKYELDRF